MRRHLHTLLFLIAFGLAGGLGPMVHRAMEHSAHGAEGQPASAGCCASVQEETSSCEQEGPETPEPQQSPEQSCDLCAVLATLLAASVHSDAEISGMSERQERIASICDLMLSVERQLRLDSRGPPSRA